MNTAIVYSMHNYTLAIANRLNQLKIETYEAKDIEDLTVSLERKNFDIIILDSSSEKNIFELVETLKFDDDKVQASILYLVPGRIDYDYRIHSKYQGSVLGMSKPFSPLEFESVTKFLIEKKLQAEKLMISYKNLEHFTVMSSHDLKTPIKNVYAYTNLLLNDLKKNQLDESSLSFKYAQIIKNESKRMISFVNDMFEFSRSGNASLDLTRINIEEFIHEVFNICKQDHESKSIEMILECDLKEIVSDENKLRHVFENLIQNAIKYSHIDKPIKIFIKCYQENLSEFIFCIKDNGIGIEKKDFDKVFLPFRRGKASYKGTGMGLAIVKRLVECMSGIVWLESEKNIGSTFYFSIKNLEKSVTNEII